MKPLFPSPFKVSHGRPRVLKSLLPFRFSFASLIYFSCSMAEQLIGSGASAAAAPTAEVLPSTSTGLAQARAPSKNFVTALDMTPEEKQGAPPLEPAFEALLRSGNIHEDVIMACRVQDILDREVFVSLHYTVEGFKEAVSAGLGIVPAVGFSHNREMAKMVKAWNSAKVQADIKTKVDAVAKAHGEPVSMLKCDWISLMTRFCDQHGDNVHESRLLAQTYFENFEEALSDGSLEAERWTKLSTCWRNVLNLPRLLTRQSTLGSTWSRACRSRPEGVSSQSCLPPQRR